MNQQVVTELVIDSNTSGADQFSQSMDKASSSAQQGTSSVANMTLAIAGVGVATIAALAGLRAFVDYVGTSNKMLVDIAENATSAGLSTREFQATLFAARSSGLTEKDFVSGLDKIGADLAAASRGVTDFGRLFEQNGLSIKQTNGDIKTSGQGLVDIMSLMQNATPQVQKAVAQIVGLSKDWIPFLREGADEFERQKQAAAGLGIIIDDGVIQKAKEFDREWRTAVAAWDLQFKASLSSILPALVQLANMAATVLNAAGQLGGFFSRSLTPVEDQSSGDVQKNLDGLIAYREQIANLNGELSEFQRFRLEFKGEALGLDNNDLATIDAAIAKMKELIQQKQAVASPTRITITGGGTTLPAIGGDANDPVDRAINSLRKHVEQQTADTLAVDQGAAAQARFRAQAAETSAVQANGGRETAAQAAAFEVLKNQAAAAADALARAKLASDIKFGRSTAFLSQEDVQIAAQLKSIYPNVADALNSAEASQLRFNAAARSLTTSIENSMVQSLTDIVSGTKSASQGFSDLAKSVLQSLEQMLIKFYIVTPIFQAFQASLGGGLGSLLGGTSSVASVAAVASADGNLFEHGNVIPFAKGGIIGGPTMAPMALMGEAGPEAVVPLQRGSDGKLGISSRGPANDNANIQFHFYNAPPVRQQTSESDGRNGRRVSVVFEDAVASVAGGPKVRQAMGSNGLVQR